ncbi:MAG: histidine kinase [Acidobacteriaceae bacterium]|nr:histidine kinase [Acidobacteriaceae bacterium]
MRGALDTAAVLRGFLLVWNVGGLGNALLIIAGYDYQSVAAKTTCAAGYTGLCFLTWSVLGVWGLHSDGPARTFAHHTLRFIALISGLVLTAWLWIDAVGANAPLSRTAIRVAAEAALYALVLAGVASALFPSRGRPSQMVRICAGVTLFGTLGPLAAIAQIPVFDVLPQTLRAAISVYAEQSVNYVAVAAFLLLARLRYTDTLVEQGLRVVSAIAAASLLWTAVHTAVPPGAALAVAVVTATAAVVLAAPFLNTALRRLTERIFQQPDFDAELNALTEAIRELPSKHEVFQRAEPLLQRAFPATQIRLLSFETFAHNSPDSRMVFEREPGSGAFSIDSFAADALVPVKENGHATYAVALARSKDQRGFLASEVAFLSGAAACISSRLQALAAERLRRQMIEAELRALRAQVNPHFLFNALNTIADLIVVDAAKAERMTERLSEVFRYVLTHSQETTITVRQEIDFVRRYLEIEEARFRERLQVAIDVAPEVQEMQVPALILQPIVENAIKHGLAPKLEGGSIVISAARRDSRLLLTVEDTGIGLARRATTQNSRGSLRSTGTGLANSMQRLRTLYGEEAKLIMESPDSRGCRVTIQIPESSACAR